MDDRIFLALCFAGLIAVLCWQRGGKRINVSEQGERGDYGPAALLSNLPDHRIRDDLTPAASFPQPMTS